MSKRLDKMYIVVCENPRDENGEIALETYLKWSSLKHAEIQKERMEQSKGKYSMGKCRIAELKFI